jgi:WD40 repeat protein
MVTTSSGAMTPAENRKGAGEVSKIRKSASAASAESPDGRYALSSSEDQTVRLWEVETGEQLAVLTGHTGWVWEVAFSPDGLTGYSTAIDGTFRVWDLREFVGAGGR